MARRRDRDRGEPSIFKRLWDSVAIKMVVFIVLFVVLAGMLTSGTGSRVADKQLEFLTDAIRRSAVQCYALEGRFPDNLAYLEENYGLIIDHKNFAVYYEPMGGNLIPQIKVIPLMH